MDLRKEFDKVVAELVSRQAEIDHDRASLDATIELQRNKELSLIEKHNDLVKRDEALGEREAIVLNAEKVVSDVAELKVLREKTSNDLTTLKAKENDLADINNVVKQREIEVSKREKVVSDREVEYKETIKTEFFAQIQRQLPH